MFLVAVTVKILRLFMSVRHSGLKRCCIEVDGHELSIFKNLECSNNKIFMISDLSFFLNDIKI